MSLKLCNYSKRIQCLFYIEYHRMIKIFLCYQTCSVFLFFYKIKMEHSSH